MVSCPNAGTLNATMVEAMSRRRSMMDLPDFQGETLTSPAFTGRSTGGDAASLQSSILGARQAPGEVGHLRLERGEALAELGQLRGFLGIGQEGDTNAVEGRLLEHVVGRLVA